MRYLPVFMRVRHRRCLVVGGGSAAAAKASLLLRAGARVTVVAPTLGAHLADLARRRQLTAVRRAFEAVDVRDNAVVIGATGLRDVDAAVSAAAQAAGIAVNVVDQPALSSFVMPAIVDRDPVMVAISSGGAAPALARKLRQSIETLLPSRLGQLARFAESFRAAVRANIADRAGRRRFWDTLFDGPVAEAVLRSDERSARGTMLELINRPDRGARGQGIVHIVGAGPGDPDLLTLRALRLLQQADVVIHDRLVGPEILDRARRDAARIYVGKSKGCHARTQAEINDLMVRLAEEGKRVVRLKGGDPFIFGRGGEELEHLRARGFQVEVVPGITAAIGCAAAAGIPLTHRGRAAAVTFISGHGHEGEPEVDWRGLARGRQTLVVYMGLSRATTVVRHLIEHGMDPATPAAVIENGTRPEQVVAAGPLAALPGLIAAHGIAGPALIVIGETASAAGAAAAHPPLPIEAGRRRAS